MTTSSSDRITNSQRVEVGRLLWPFAWDLVDVVKWSAVTAGAETFNGQLLQMTVYLVVLWVVTSLEYLTPMSHFYICNSAMSRGSGHVSHVWVKKLIYARYGPHLLLQHVSSVAHIWDDDSNSLVKCTSDTRWQSLLNDNTWSSLCNSRRSSHVIKCWTILNFYFEWDNFFFFCILTT